MVPDPRPPYGRVLVRMPTTRDSELTASLLREVGVATTLCADLNDLCRELRGGADGVVMTDDLLASDTSGQLAEAVRAQPGWSSLPFILVTREGAAQRVQQTSTDVLRNVVVIERPVRTRSLVSVALSALRARAQQYQIRDAILEHVQQARESRRLHEELQHSQDALARQAEHLRSADRKKDEFLATLAHELRNPLAPIRTGMEVLDESVSGAPGRETLGVMRRQLTHLVRLIDDLLDISRITRGKLELRCERVTLGSLLASALEEARPAIDAAGHALRVDVPDEGAERLLDVDPTRIAQVVANLLHNASKYTPPGGHLSLRARVEREYVTIEVLDDGIGIPPERIDEIFLMFNQVDAVIERSQGGLGIGLALVRKLVEMHGGTVSAQSDGSGRGSTFRVRLPVARPAGAVSSVPAPPLATPRRPALGHGRVIVVDDNVDAADLLAMMLRQAGYSVTALYDGESAIAAVTAEPPSFVILDIGLPVMNGYEVARELRKRVPRERLGLIALTGWGTADDRRKAMDAGFDVHLTKPIDAGALHEALATVEKRLNESAPASSTMAAP